MTAPSVPHVHANANAILPFAPTETSVVRLVTTIHKHHVRPILYHVLNLFPRSEEEQNRVEEWIHQFIQIPLDDQGKPLCTWDTEVDEHKKIKGYKMYWNVIVEKLPLDVQELEDVERELMGQRPRELVPRHDALLSLLYRCVDIAKTLQIRTIVWPKEQEHVVARWRASDPYAKQMFILMIEDSNSPVCDVVQYYAHDKALINAHLDNVPQRTVTCCQRRQQQHDNSCDHFARQFDHTGEDDKGNSSHVMEDVTHLCRFISSSHVDDHASKMTQQKETHTDNLHSLHEDGAIRDQLDHLADTIMIDAHTRPSRSTTHDSSCTYSTCGDNGMEQYVNQVYGLYFAPHSNVLECFGLEGLYHGNGVACDRSDIDDGNDDDDDTETFFSLCGDDLDALIGEQFERQTMHVRPEDYEFEDTKVCSA